MTLKPAVSFFLLTGTVYCCCNSWIHFNRDWITYSHSLSHLCLWQGNFDLHNIVKHLSADFSLRPHCYSITTNLATQMRGCFRLSLVATDKIGFYKKKK